MTIGTVLLTLGRLPVALELARAFHDAGWRVIVAEPCSWHLCRLSRCVDKSFRVTSPALDSDSYRRELVDIVTREEVTCVVPVSEEALFVAQLKPYLPDNVRLLCLTHETLLQLHDKLRFIQLAERMDLAVPATALASDRQGMARITEQAFIVKPRLSCSGVGVRASEAAAALNEAERSEKYIVQQRLPGTACSSFSIAAHGHTLISVCYRSVLESGSVSVCFEQMEVPDEVADLIAGIVRAVNYTGMIAFDFLQDDNGRWCAIECNPRATSGLHFLPPDTLLAALLDQRAVTGNAVQGRRQEFWSCLLQTEAALFKGTFDRAAWKRLFSTRDITWCWSDMKPFLLMSLVMAPQLYRAFRTGRPVSALLMVDVGWHEH